MDKTEERPLGADLRRTDNLIKGFVDQTVQSRISANVTGIEGMILGFIFRHIDEENTSKMVMERMHSSRATTSQSLNGLVKKGFIEMVSSKEDKRKKIIHLTEKGTAVHLEFNEIFKDIMAQVEAGITPEEKKAFRETLAKIRDNVGGRKP